MGLAEKRKQKELQEGALPERVKEYKEITGTDIAIEVDWASFPSADELNFLDNVSCHRIGMALRPLCSDDVGKALVQANLKTIKLSNVATVDVKSIALSGGVLSCACCYSLKMDGAFSDSEIWKVLTAAPANGAATPSGWGMNEQRKQKELLDTTLPERVKDYKEITGADIAVEVDWTSFTSADELNFLDNVSCHRIAMALRVICTDSIGKEAVQESLKTIKLRNAAAAGDKSVALSQGVLSCACCYTLRMDGAFTESEIRQICEAAL